MTPRRRSRRTAGWPGSTGGRADGAGNENGAGRWRGQPLADPYPWPGQEPRDPGAWPTESYRDQAPAARNKPGSPGWRGRSADRAEPRSAPGRGDLSDLWRDPDPWAAEAQRGREPGPERDAGAGDDRAGPTGEPPGEGLPR